ncbi:MAG: hypothetical protein N4A33_13210 [Bacteriovoracaceae bacterium]|jgi:hypothetical protein|nr:hypothetical protein [Bacteriovoracaceae bacterium]
MAKTSVEILFYPGRYYSSYTLRDISDALCKVAAKCFEQVPIYQALSGKKEDLSRTVIAVAKDHNGTIKGFCSAIIYNIEGVGKVFHTGLTCVDPKYRGEGLTHKLTSKLLTSFIFKEALFEKIYVTNCACVLSSIGNVALHFENVYPSPFGPKEPTGAYKKIAREISTYYRDDIAINDDAIFDEVNFVFRGSVEGTVFQKSQADTRFYHRKSYINEYYRKLLNFDRGDEVLQVGQVSALTFVKYIIKKYLRFFKKNTKIEHDYATSN